MSAKDVQDPIAIAVFQQAYFEAAKKALRELIRAHHIESVILPKLSLGRVVGLHWHPVDFWMSVIHSLQSEGVCAHNIEVFMRAPSPTTKQSMTPSWLRRQNLSKRVQGEQEYNNVTCSAEDIEVKGRRGAAVFLDDVLTSGGTLLEELASTKRRWTVGRSAFASASVSSVAKSERRLRPHMNAHILTLFRTPVADSMKGNVT